MRFLDNARLALAGLKMNKMRTFLTMLGIIIGIASVISIVTIGHSLTTSVSKGFDSLGSNQIYFYNTMADENDFESFNNEDNFTIEQLFSMEDAFDGRIKAFTVEAGYYSGTISDRRNEARVNLVGSTDGMKDVGNLKMVYGRFINRDDVIKKKKIAVISDKVVAKIFNDNPKEAIGQEITIKSDMDNYDLVVVGVYKYEIPDFGVFGGMTDSDNIPTEVYSPYSAILSSWDSEYFNSFTLVAQDRDDINQLGMDIENYFNNTVRPGNDKVITISTSMESQLQEISSVMSTIQLGIGAIAAISLLVGGIGVMNILLVSVTERTREIGIRKALGATNNDIRGQFLTESIIICIIGGIIGVILGAVIGLIGSNLMENPTLPPVSSVIVAVGFSMAVGLFFGYYPANKAAKLNPIDALRFD